MTPKEVQAHIDALTLQVHALRTDLYEATKREAKFRIGQRVYAQGSPAVLFVEDLRYDPDTGVIFYSVGFLGEDGKPHRSYKRGSYRREDMLEGAEGPDVALHLIAPPVDPDRNRPDLNAYRMENVKTFNQ